MAWLIPIAAVAVLSCWRDWNFWSFLFSHPAAFDLSSGRFLLAQHVVPLLPVAAMGLSCRGAGWLVLRGFKVDSGDPAAFGLGLGGLACAVSALAAAGFLNRTALAAAAVIFAALGLRELGTIPFFHVAPRGFRPWLIGLAVPVSYVAFHALIVALAPPTGYDVTAYHLAIPKLYAKAGGMVALPWLFHSRWPHLMETFYAVPLIFGSETAPALIHALLCAVLVFAVYATAKEELGENAAWLAAALFSCQPVLHYVISDAHSDGALALFHFLACLSLWRWTKMRESGWLIAAAVLSGCGAACKLQGLVLTAALAASVWRKRGNAPLFLCLAAPFFAPWYARTWLATGNPVWPFLSSVFGDVEHAAKLAAGLREFNGWVFPRDLPLFMRYGPHFILLPIAALALLARRAAKPPAFLKFMLWPLAPLVLAAAPSHELWRYLLPQVPALALYTAWLALAAIKRGGWRKSAALAAVAFSLSPAFSLSQSNELFYALGIKSISDPNADRREHYLERATPYLAFYRDAAVLLKPRDKIVLIRDVRGYRLDADYQWFEGSLEYELDASGTTDLKGFLRERGFTYAIVHDEPGWFTSFTPYSKTAQSAQRAVERGGRLILREGAYTLYSL